MEARRSRFLEAVLNLDEKKGKNSRLIRRSEYENKINRLNQLKEGAKREPEDTNLIHSFELAVFGDVIVLMKRDTNKRVVCVEDMFDVISSAHSFTGHGGRTTTGTHLGKSFHNITRNQVAQFISQCEECQLKRTRPRKGIVVKPILSKELNSRCQVSYVIIYVYDCDYLPLLSFTSKFVQCVGFRLTSSTCRVNQTVPIVLY